MNIVKLILLPMSLGMLCISCAPPAKHTAVQILIDPTDTISQDVEQITAYLLDNILQVNYSDNIRNEATVLISRISGSGPVQQFKKIHLSAGEHFIFRNEVERQKEVQAFCDTLGIELKQHFQPGLPQNQSYIFGAVAEQLPHLVNIPADSRYAFIFSDGLENNATYSFYYYRNKVNSLQKQQSTLVETFTQHYSLPPLQGIEFYFVHLPVKDQQLHLAARKIWAGFLEIHGASNIRFVSNL